MNESKNPNNLIPPLPKRKYRNAVQGNSGKIIIIIQVRSYVLHIKPLQRVLRTFHAKYIPRFKHYYYYAYKTLRIT